MLKIKRLGPLTNGRFVFFKQFLKHPLQIGSIIPSSRFLEQRILDCADVASAATIVELGPGIGNMTRTILGAMRRDARLLSLEINPLFHQMVNRIRDDRLIAHLGSAADLAEIVAAYGLEPPEVVISGIPFSTMGPAVGFRVLEAVASLLAPNGCFVAYQVSNKVASLCRPLMGSEQVELELFNIPPMRVYKWEKSGRDLQTSLAC